ncbi:unnamed protein product [marine sediment metagenome]|uniref:Uncharacterized protein n=1 Tax=marine sediment metagenome TaxID=412755 RepID=X1CJ27_9ZZZZ
MALGAESAQADDYKAVPFFGATELKFANGPAFVGVPYIAKGKIACVGVSRKTEYVWRDCHLEEKETGKIVAKLFHLDRFMKQGSSLYPEN